MTAGVQHDPREGWTDLLICQQPGRSAWVAIRYVAATDTIELATWDGVSIHGVTRRRGLTFEQLRDTLFPQAPNTERA